MAETTAFETIDQQSTWYGARAQRNRSTYVRLKGVQLVLAAAVPVVAVAAASDVQRWTTAGLGALLGVIEGFIQLGQYQQNWLLYRATRDALKREAFLYQAGAGPYSGSTNADGLYVERCDAVMSGEHAKWLTIQVPAKGDQQTSQPAA